jgi:hypothetical protein
LSKLQAFHRLVFPFHPADPVPVEADEAEQGEAQALADLAILAPHPPLAVNRSFPVKFATCAED